MHHSRPLITLTASLIRGCTRSPLRSVSFFSRDNLGLDELDRQRSAIRKWRERPFLVDALTHPVADDAPVLSVDVDRMILTADAAPKAALAAQALRAYVLSRPEGSITFEQVGRALFNDLLLVCLELKTGADVAAGLWNDEEFARRINLFYANDPHAKGKR